MSLRFRTLFVLFPLFCVFSLLLFIGTPAFGQSASVSGRVIDPSAAAVRKAQITLIDLAKGTSQTTQTNDGGFYSLPFVQPGSYTLAVESSGFKRFERTRITVETAQSLVVDVRLQVGETSQSVTVDGSGAHINTTDASVSTVIDRQFVQNIPLNGRSFQSLMTAVPGVSVTPSDGVGASGEITVNGQRTEANQFTVDGVSVNTGAATSIGIGVGGGFAGSTPGETALGTTQSLVSIEALQEFRAITSTYSAEYGRTPGGQLLFLTRSGTNEWHGSAFDYLRNGAMDANNWFNNNAGLPRPAERQNDFGGTIGGPVVIPGMYNGKDKTFFFFSYEGLRLQNPQAAVPTEVPSASLRTQVPAALQPILNAYPVPNGSDAGNGLAFFTQNYSVPGSLDSSSIRMDHSFSDRFKVFGRYSNAPSSTLSRSPNNLAVMNRGNSSLQTVTFGATNLLSTSLTNDFRFNWTANDSSTGSSLDSFGGATPYTVANLPGLSSSSWLTVNLLYATNPYTIMEPKSGTQDQINLVDTVDATIGRHNLRWGIDYRRISTTQTLPDYFAIAIYSAESQLLANTPISAPVRKYGIPELAPIYTNFSAFLQDEWRMNRRLNLSLGVRWELNPSPGDANGNRPYALTSADYRTMQVAPKGSPLWHTTYGNFAPRVGLAYRLNDQENRSTTLRAGFGLFYDTGNENASNGYNGLGFSGIQNLAGTSFPFSAAQLSNIPAPSVAAPYEDGVYGFDPNLKLPYTLEWNLALEQAIGQNQTFTMTYVGSRGRKLLMEQNIYPQDFGNQSFGPSSAIYYTFNGGSSNYDALQLQFQRKLSNGLQALLGYTWSHSIDNVSSNFINDTNFLYQRGDSDFDVRHNFQAALTYDIPASHHLRQPVVSSLVKDWSIDGRLSARSSRPVDIIATQGIDPSTNVYISYHPSIVEGQPLYLHDKTAPGGRVINFAAFQKDTDSNGNTIDGDLHRNTLRGFGAAQLDLAIRREFHLVDRFGLQFRAEAFNITNHPVFGSIYNQLTYGASLFGRAYNTENQQLGGLNALYQVGGPRSLQVALRLHF